MGYDRERYGELEPKWPHHWARRLMAACGVLLVLVALATLWPGRFMPVLEPANPMAGPAASPLPWYLAPVELALRWLPAPWAMGGLALALAALCLLPFWERSPRRVLWARPVFSKLLVVLAACYLLTLLWWLWRALW